MSTAYEMVIGLEVHVELKTNTKIFCGCATTFGAPPNTHVCPVCMGLPGSLPVLNKKVVDYAVMAGLATHCRIARRSRQDRKNYFYPDLPKAYQISQYDLPLCEDGYLDIETGKGEKRIGITRIHIEEDAGKLVHDKKHGTLIDMNRCGVPLIEIVSEPDIRSAEEARAYLQKLRAILLTAGVSDCRMNEGSFRCDVNLSVREKGQEAFGTRTEMKNLNSFQNVVKAIEFEYKRQVEAIEAGEDIIQETRRFDPYAGRTTAMRSKEDANDYRYFPDPDLPPIVLTDAQIKAYADNLPEMPDERKRRYMRFYGLSAMESEAICASAAMTAVFEAAVGRVRDVKLLCNLMTAELAKLIPAEGDSPVSGEALSALVNMQAAGDVNAGTAKKVLREMAETGRAPEAIVEDQGLKQISDADALRALAERVISENEALVKSYRSGKLNAIKGLMGRVMTLSGGKANPVLAQQALERLLAE